MKPNYSKRVIDANYSVGHFYGNHYFGHKGTRGINELSINGFVVRFIPNYDFSLFSFPPTNADFRKITNPQSMQESRVSYFEGANLVFFAHDDAVDQSFSFDYQYFVSANELATTSGLIHCISTSLFQKLTKEMQRKMPYIVSDRKLRHPIKRKDIKDLKFIQFLDEKFLALKSLLPDNFQKSLENK